MANRRMLSKTITDSSAFLQMPLSSQALYLHLNQHADDDGYCEFFGVMRMCGANIDDMKVLEIKSFVEVFDDRVLVLKDWTENNYIQKDRYQPSKYLNVYKADTKCIQPVSSMDTQVRLGKVSKVKDSKEIQNTIKPLEAKASGNEPEFTFWTSKTGTTIRGKYDENIKAAHRLKDSLGGEKFTRAVETIRIVRADAHAGRFLHVIGNYIQLEKNIEAIEAYRQGVEDRPNFDIVNRKKMVSI